MSIVWHEVPGVTDYQVGFSHPCPRKFGSALSGQGCRQDCCTYNHPEKHGHLHLRTEEGVARFLFCCFSQEGVRRLANHFVAEGFISAAAVAVIMSIPEVLVLPALLTEIEKRILRSPRKWKRDRNFVITCR